MRHTADHVRTDRIIGFPHARFRFFEDQCLRCGFDAGIHRTAGPNELHCDDCECGRCHP